MIARPLLEFRMRRSALAAAVSALALLAPAFPLLAQTVDPQPLTVGDALEAGLDAQDPVSEDSFWGQYRYDDYRVAARAGQRLEAIMRAEAFDAFLAIYAEGATHDEPLASDDDGLGDGTHARLRFTPSRDGVYILRARTLMGTDGGAYSLSLDERPAGPPEPAPRPVRLGDRIDGELSEGAPQSDEGAGFDAYAVTAAAGERISISMRSEAFDPYLRIGRSADGAFSELAFNDDAPGEGLNARLVFTAPEAGTYVVRATAFSPGAQGAYVLEIAAGPERAASQAITLGQTVRGDLTSDAAVNDAGTRVAPWRFTGRAGQRVDIAVESAVFDTYLTLYRDRDGVLEILAQDDDGGRRGTNSRLLQTLDEAGDYLIEVSSFADVGSGAYTLHLKEAAPEPAPVPIAWGATVQGEIADGDGEDSNGRLFDSYVFSGAEGQRIHAIMRSGDFDAFVRIGRPGETFEALASDDDGLGEGTDSRLAYTLPETGEYVLRVSPLGPDIKGLYSLELVDRGPQPEPGSILIGATARGALTEADALSDEGVFFDAYRVQAKAGDKLRLTMVSNAFDAFIEVGRQDGETFESLARDDDGLSDTHARLDWTVEEDGEYVIRARAYAPNQSGAYVLIVERKP